MVQRQHFSGRMSSSFLRFLCPQATSSLFRLVDPAASGRTSWSSIIRSGTSFHSGGTSSIYSALASSSLFPWWFSAWILSCIPSLTAISSESSGIIWISSIGSGGISGSSDLLTVLCVSSPPCLKVPPVALLTLLCLTICQDLYPQDLLHGIISTCPGSLTSLLQGSILV